MNISIREYEKKDRKQLLECVTQLQDFVASLDPLKRLRRRKDFDAEEYLKQTLQKVSKNNGIIYVAEESNEIVGCVVGIIKMPEADNLEGYPSMDGFIQELIIFPEHRGKRVGAMLMAKMEEYFWKKKCSVIKLECFAPNHPAHAFYKKLGYEDRLIILIKSKNHN